ncbi:Pkinase-domain-containing protein [Lentinula edodes]|uniref:Pkinase-domain-containing protein n=1 Tax=Lentinula edodes TaxID=5353 RepID=A0A1Q3EFX4_LENED|nr:Pkinase-domain-containing protein [Lentinula edodes]
MVNDKTYRSSSSSSTWASSMHTNASQIMNDRSLTSRSSLQTLASSRHYTPVERSSNNSERTLQAVKSTVSPPLSSASYPSFQWIRGDLIGEGSYGRVYWALNVTTGDIIAVKQVDLARNPSRREKESIEALKFESYTLKDLDHPNIVQFLGFEESVEHLSIMWPEAPSGAV